MGTRKGQSAMEYMMTYGWAILIIVVISAVLVYYGLFKPPVGKSISGFGSIMPLDVDYDSAGTMRLYLENRVGDIINVTSVTVDNTPLAGLSPTAMSIAGRSWVNGSTSESGDPGEAYSFDMAVTYVRAYL